MNEYFKAGESVTIQAGVNGFIVYAEDGELIAANAEQMVNIVLAKITHHHELVAEQQRLEAEQGEPVEAETAEAA